MSENEWRALRPVRARMHEFGTAALLLTRLPARRIAGTGIMFAPSVWAFPLLGTLLGALAAAAFAIATAVRLPAPLAAIVAVATLVLLSGALHEDGLADTADGLAGRSPEQSLAIMRDSRLGSYGAVALFLSLAFRVAAVAALDPRRAPAGLVVAACVSRASMVGLPLLLSPARRDGLGAGFARPPRASVAAGLAIAFLVVSVFVSLSESVAIAVAASGALGLVAWSAARRLRGYTGDTFGAVQQIAECAALSVLVAWPVPPT